MRQLKWIMVGLVALVVGGCVEYQEKGNLMFEEDPSFIGRYDVGALMDNDREGVYTDSTTGTVHEDTYYVDPAGWSINEVSSLEDYYPTYWQMYANKNEGIPPYVMAWNDKHAAGFYKLLHYAIEHSPRDYLVFTMNFPHGMQLIWQQNATIELHVAEKGRHVVYVSRRVFFTRNQQTEVVTSKTGPVALAHNEGLDNPPPKDIVATARFDFGGNAPGTVLFCRVQHVVATGEAVSVR